MMKSLMICLVASLVLLAPSAPLAVMTGEGAPLNEAPLNQTAEDTGDIIPARLIYGHVTRQPGRYILGPGDTVTLKIKDLPEYDQTVTVGPDGFAAIHPFGDYRIAGMDLSGLDTWLEERFKTYLLKPQVTVALTEMRPALIYVMGEVQRPGTYQFVRDKLSNTDRADQKAVKIETTLTNVLAQAGGLKETADIQNIQIVHGTTQQVETFDLLAFLQKGEGQDIVLMPEDKLVIPKAQNPMDPATFSLVSRSTYFEERFPVVVLGSVQKQGEVLLDPNNNTLNAAIALAGGYLPVSRKNRVLIHRPGEQGQYQDVTLDPRKAEHPLRPGDVVIVANSTAGKIEHLLKGLALIGTNAFFSTNAIRNYLDIRDRNKTRSPTLD